MKERTIFYLKFYKLIDKIRPGVGARISVWIEEDPSFLTPCEFIEVVKERDFYNIGIILFDVERFSSERNIGKKFFFGPPSHEIGYGILEKIQPVKKTDV